VAVDAVSEEQHDAASSAACAGVGFWRGYPLRRAVEAGGPLDGRGSGLGVAEETDVRGLQAPVSSNSFWTVRLRVTVPVWVGGGGGWFTLAKAKGVPARLSRGRGDGDGERDRVDHREKPVER
jgi:hypothetical protein